MPGLQIANTSWVFAALGAALFYLWLNPDKIKNRGAFKVGFYLYVVAFFAVLFFAPLHAGASSPRAEKMIGALLNGISWLMAGVVTLSLFLSLPPLPTLARAARPAREREPGEPGDLEDDEDEDEPEEKEAPGAASAADEKPAKRRSARAERPKRKISERLAAAKKPKTKPRPKPKADAGGEGGAPAES